MGEERDRGQARRKIQSKREGGGGSPLKKMGLGLGFFVFFSDVVKITPPGLAENEGYL
jgi:hypothetical protein